MSRYISNILTGKIFKNDAMSYMSWGKDEKQQE